MIRTQISYTTQTQTQTQAQTQPQTHAQMEEEILPTGNSQQKRVLKKYAYMYCVSQGLYQEKIYLLNYLGYSGGEILLS